MGEEKDRTQVTRLYYWGALTVSSAISLGSVVQASKSARDSHSRYLISVAAITMSIGTLYTIALARKIGAMLKFEMPSVFASLVLWAIGLGVLFHKTTLVQGEAGLVSNANLYYFSWAALVTSVLLFAELLKCPLGIDKGSELEDATRRFNSWVFLCATSLIAMSSSAGIYRSSDCYDAVGSSSCKKLKISVAFGAIVAGLALIMMVTARILREKESLKLIVEGVTAVIAVVLYALSVAYTTAPGAPGALIGNLYYFTWFSFVISVMLLLDCFREFRIGGEETPAEPTTKEVEAAQQPPAEAPLAEEQA